MSGPGFRVGIDLGGTKIEGVVLDRAGSVVQRHRVPTEAQRGYQHIVDNIAGLASEMLAQAPGCELIGVGTPGAVSGRTGVIKNSNTQCLNGRDIRGDLQKVLPCSVLIENDANCFALAEAQQGAGRGFRCVFGVIMGTGVGGGIVFDGKVHTGGQRIGGEWGHHSIDPDGPECYCGRRGCVETLLSGTGIARAYKERVGAELDATGVVAAARVGDPLATAVFEEFIANFGRAMANVINILDPDVVVLGGGVSNIDELYTRGRAAVEPYVFGGEFRTPIVKHQLGDSAGVIGAAWLG